MYYIKRLPLLLALFATIISGIIGLVRSMTNDKILLQMIVTMVVFYIIGFIARHNLETVYNQVKEKKEKEKIEALKEEEKQKEQKQKEKMSKEKNENILDEFESLKVSKIIREELKQSEK